MGLCKCPKRKVTNLFCFEHRVNVCEWCLVASHESCVVQTYLSWLTDSDFDPNCALCSEPLPNKETVRLKCLHLFHWDCLNAREDQLPPNTAPAGYKCPSCLECIFPAERQTSPVVDQLKEKLRGASWARSGMDGVAESDGEGNGYDVGQPAHAAENHHQRQPAVDPFQVVNTFTVRATKGGDSNHSNSSQYTGTGAHNYYNGPSTVVSSASLPLMKAMDGSNDLDGLMDESKYAKRGGERNGLKHRWARLPRSVKRILLGLATCFVIYFLLTALFGSGGRESVNKSAGEDVLFDPHANPNIRIESKSD